MRIGPLGATLHGGFRGQPIFPLPDSFKVVGCERYMSSNQLTMFLIVGPLVSVGPQAKPLLWRAVLNLQNLESQPSHLVSNFQLPNANLVLLSIPGEGQRHIVGRQSVFAFSCSMGRRPEVLLY
jgi:hypothetical protein